MSKVFLLLLLLLSLLAGFSRSATVDGKAVCIEQKVVRDLSKGQPAVNGKQRICFTDAAIRNETTYAGFTTVAILDLNAGLISLIPGKKHQYVQMHLADYRKLVAMRLGALGMSDPGLKSTFVRTDKLKTIRSWSCRLYTFEQDGKIPVKAQLWVAENTGVDFKRWFEMMDRLGLLSAMGDLGQDSAKIEGVPIELKIQQTVFGQSLQTDIDVTKIEMDVPAQGLFVVPDDYEKIEAESSEPFSE